MDVSGACCKMYVARCMLHVVRCKMYVVRCMFQDVCCKMYTLPRGCLKLYGGVPTELLFVLDP